MAKPDKPPSFADMMWPTLQALKDTGGSASNEELLSRVVQIVGIPEAIQKIPYRHGTLLEDRLHWARTYLRKVGAIESSERGIWSITGNGRALTESEVKGIPARVKEILRQDSGRGDQGREAKDEEPEEGVAENWQDKLLSILQAMSSEGFERLAQRILRESGFIKVEVKGKSGDGGIDGIGILRLNLLSFQVFFQCKRYRDSVGASAIRDFRGGMVGRTDKVCLSRLGALPSRPNEKRRATGLLRLN
jgi:restriction system protein